MNEQTADKTTREEQQPFPWPRFLKERPHPRSSFQLPASPQCPSSPPPALQSPSSLRIIIPAVARFAKRFSSLLKVFSSLFLCLVPWVKMSASSDKLKTMSLVDLALSIVIIIVVHYVYAPSFGMICRFLLFTELVCKLTKSPTPITKSLALSCSMKTLPIAMTSCTCSRCSRSSHLLPSSGSGKSGFDAPPRHSLPLHSGCGFLRS